MDFDTLCIHGSDYKYDSTGAVSVPIFQSATFAHPGVGKSTGYDYSRQQNPTREHLEKTIACLECGLDALAFSSGMAAISELTELFSPGDHLIVSDDLYGGSHRLFTHISSKNGISFTFINTSDLTAVLSGIKTLPIRMEHQQDSALKIALWLSCHEKIKTVYYAGLESHPGHAISKKQASGFGAMISFDTDSEETALNILNEGDSQNGIESA